MSQSTNRFDIIFADRPGHDAHTVPRGLAVRRTLSDVFGATRASAFFPPETTAEKLRIAPPHPPTR